MNRAELKACIEETYNAISDFPWESDPDYEVFRHGNNKKWFALIMNIPKAKLGLPSDEMTDVVNLKCDPLLIGSLRSEPGIFPAYHMSKEHWITVALDGSVPDDKLKMLLDMSFELTSVKGKRKNRIENDF